MKAYPPSLLLLVLMTLLSSCDSDKSTEDNTSATKDMSCPDKNVEPNYRLVFVSNRIGDSGIYSVGADGTGFRALASSLEASDPTWSPDGKSILFTADGDLWVVDYCGENKRQITDTPNMYESLGIWSPDGTFIVCVSSSNEGGYSELSLMDANGGNRKILTSAERYYDTPTWSPDGKRIAFTASAGDDDAGIFVIDADGTNLINLTDNTDGGYTPTWAPDGNRIAFYADRSGNGDIYLMNADGTDVTNLTNSTVDESIFGARWSPDGQLLVYDAVEESGTAIFVIRSDGSSRIGLTEDFDSAWDPRWSPDGTHISFTTYAENNDEIYVMKANGSDRINVSKHASDDSGAKWSPTMLR